MDNQSEDVKKSGFESDRPECESWLHHTLSDIKQGKFVIDSESLFLHNQIWSTGNLSKMGVEGRQQ